MKEMAHLTCGEEVAVEGVEVEGIITMEGSSTMEMVGGKDMVDGMMGVVMVDEVEDEEEVVVDIVDVGEVTVAVLHNKISVVIMITEDQAECLLLLDMDVVVVVGVEGVGGEDVVVVGI